ncbi:MULTISPECIES: hypothetical protein [unclassified Thiocapsa]|uniref:hypothetical protein n=1 Tax=unclassified Thiocapsa TaxID=2641286 RepID=UPI0035B1409A
MPNPRRHHWKQLGTLRFAQPTSDAGHASLHLPMMREHFAEVSERIRYFEIGDLDVEAPATAIARLTQAIDLEIAALPSNHGV